MTKQNVLQRQCTSPMDIVLRATQRNWQRCVRMTWPTKELEEVVFSGRPGHGGNPVLRWMAGNVSTETDAADNWKTSKKKSRERIDGIVA